MKYKLLALDLDGTLLNDRGEISKKNRDKIRQAKEAGVRVILTTGRSWRSTKRYIDELDLGDPVVTFNGALIQDNQHILKRVTIDDKLVKEIILFLKDLDFAPIIYPDDNLKYYETLGNFKNDFYDFSKGYEKELIKVDDISAVNWKNVLRISVIAEKPDISFLHSELKKKFNSNIKTVDTFFFLWGFWIFEILPRDCSKSNALKFICKMYSIKQEEVIAAGDNNNDIDMINWAGMGVAMKNSLDNIFREADYVTENSNNEDGVAEIIDKFILNEDQSP